MPYIAPELRVKIDQAIDQLVIAMRDATDAHNVAGVVNYTISRLLTSLFSENYNGYNSALGVLEAVKLEFYRRRIGPYEDGKIISNGDLIEWERTLP
jgi:hypothetical protein